MSRKSLPPATGQGQAKRVVIKCLGLRPIRDAPTAPLALGLCPRAPQPANLMAVVLCTRALSPLLKSDFRA